MLFANVFILAHGALPHSHHDGTVCLSLEELLHHNNCLNNNTDGEVCCEQNHTKHHHHKNAENCDLKEIVLRQDNDPHIMILFFVATVCHYYMFFMR